MKRIFWLSISFALGLVLVFSVSTAKANNEFRIKVSGGQTSWTVDDPSKDVVIWWRWIACSRGQTIAFTHSLSENQHVLDGTPLFNSLADANQNWGRPQPIDTPDFEVCVRQGGTEYVIFWERNLGPLAPGNYVLVSSATTAHPIIDGHDPDGIPGMEPFDGVLFNRTHNITVNP